ncbi:hypothetical protein A3Q56_05801 [Intoshia linei]|uniref:ADF-H domain-containing protein n=1 Tax=Intoshia linei TaxID=1819745 RepID=A0A177AY80_9BILA|nr:hypothetical protein A3Q56_05801 [Intoshia linei]
MAPKTSSKRANPMQKIGIDKLCLNVCVGESGDRLTRAAKVLQQLTGQQPLFSKSRLTINTFGIRRNEKIAVHTTVRGDMAKELLEKGLKVKEYELRLKNFSPEGNFGFGISEHIDLGCKYDPTTGIYGMDFYIVLSKPGTRVSKRKINRARRGTRNKITKDEAMDWFQKTISGFTISDEVFELIDSIYKKKQRFVIMKFDKLFKNLEIVKKGGRESTYDEVYEYLMTECTKSFCYVYFDFHYQTNSGQSRDRVVLLKMGVPEQAPIKEKMIYASSYKALQDATKSQINIDCTDQASFELDSIVQILLSKHESTN